MIELKNITTGYSKDKPLVKNFSYTFDNNKIYGVLGHSGCGKSTMLKTIAGLIKPLEGEVFIDGKKVTKAGDNNAFMMHQNYVCFPWKNCLDNILIADLVRDGHNSKEDIEQARELLKAVGLEGCEKMYPQQLSGGMRQRLALARTIFIQPKILLMDEPMSALDAETREFMQDVVTDLHNKTKNTIILVTHSPKEAEKLSDEIITLKKAE